MIELLRKKFLFIIFSLSGVGLIGFFFKEWISNLLIPIFSALNQFLEDVVFPSIESALFFKVPIYLILVFIILGLFIYKIFYLIKLKQKHFKIIKAKYGIGNKWVNITNELNSHIIENKLNIPLSNGIHGKDPAKNKIKIGVITYKFGNNIFERKYKERDIIKLP